MNYFTQTFFYWSPEEQVFNPLTGEQVFNPYGTTTAMHYFNVTHRYIHISSISMHVTDWHHWHMNNLTKLSYGVFLST